MIDKILSGVFCLIVSACMIFSVIAFIEYIRGSEGVTNRYAVEALSETISAQNAVISDLTQKASGYINPLAIIALTAILGVFFLVFIGLILSHREKMAAMNCGYANQGNIKSISDTRHASGREAQEILEWNDYQYNGNSYMDNSHFNDR